MLPKSFCLASDIPDPLNQYQTKDVKGTLQKMTGEWRKINNWGIGLYARNIEPYFGKYIDRVAENAKQGLEEEKQEYKENLFKTLGIAWEKIKTFLFNK